MFKANVYKIMIGGPSDVKAEVDVAIEVVNHWNSINAEAQRMMLLPLHWTISAYPEMGKRPQQALNEQLVNKSDALICIFGSKLGTPTGDYLSGSVEEIEEHRKEGKPVMVFFKTTFGKDTDLEEMAKLREFQKKIEGLYSEFDNRDTFEKLLNDKLALMVNANFTKGESDADGVTKGIVAGTEGLTEDDLEMLGLWIASDNETTSKYDFLGGTSLLTLGNIQIDIKSARENVKWNAFFDRLEKADLVEIYDYNKQNNPCYRLKEKAYLLVDSLK